MMKKLIITAVMIVLIVMSLQSCSKDADGIVTTPLTTLTLELNGLESLNNGASYEGWIIVDDVPMSTGKFITIESVQTFMVNANYLEQATEFIISIEPSGDEDAIPSETKLLSGLFNENDEAMITIDEVIGDFFSASGKFIIATPTDLDSTNEQNGIWFEDPTGFAGVVPGLNLPDLENGWKYEGWIVFNEIPVTTGKFTSVNSSDEASSYGGTSISRPFPGEDFLSNAPNPLIFPLDGDVQEKTVFISVEPDPDFDTLSPFFVKPLLGKAGKVNTTLHSLLINDNPPFGRVLR